MAKRYKGSSRTEALRARDTGNIPRFPKSSAELASSSSADVRGWFNLLLQTSMFSMVNAGYSVINLNVRNCRLFLSENSQSMLAKCFTVMGVMSSDVVEEDIQKNVIQGKAYIDPSSVDSSVDMSYVDFVQEAFPEVLKQTLSNIQEAFCSSNHVCEVPMPDELNKKLNVIVTNILPSICTQFTEAMRQRGQLFSVDTTTLSTTVGQIVNTTLTTVLPTPTEVTTTLGGTTTVPNTIVENNDPNASTAKAELNPLWYLAAVIVACGTLYGVYQGARAASKVYLEHQQNQTSWWQSFKNYFFPAPPTAPLEVVNDAYNGPSETAVENDAHARRGSIHVYNALSPRRESDDDRIYHDIPSVYGHVSRNPQTSEVDFPLDPSKHTVLGATQGSTTDDLKVSLDPPWPADETNVDEVPDPAILDDETNAPRWSGSETDPYYEDDDPLHIPGFRVSGHPPNVNGHPPSVNGRPPTPGAERARKK